VGGVLQAGDQTLDFGGGAGGALGEGTYFVRDHSKSTSGLPGAGGFDGGVECQQVGLVGNRANNGEHAADGGGLFSKFLDHLRVLLHFADQRMQTGQAQADHPLALFHRLARAAAGAGGLARIAGDLLDGRFEFAQGVADLRRVARLAFSAVMQAAAQFGEGAAAAGHFFGIAANGAHQVHQVSAQTVQRGFDVAQFAVGLAQCDRLAEVAFGPGG